VCSEPIDPGSLGPSGQAHQMTVTNHLKRYVTKQLWPSLQHCLYIPVKRVSLIRKTEQPVPRQGLKLGMNKMELRHEQYLPRRHASYTCTILYIGNTHHYHPFQYCTYWEQLWIWQNWIFQLFQSSFQNSFAFWLIFWGTLKMEVLTKSSEFPNHPSGY
jgi:hypothetical protein